MHRPLVAGVVITALGLKTTLHQVADTDHYGLAEPLRDLPAWALAGGTGLFLPGSAAILLRTTGRRAPALLTGGTLCLAAPSAWRQALWSPSSRPWQPSPP
ncbi:low temperature requirement protein A [Streptomyces sp. NPDC057438]|uniref:low temperature requirement protein A n=1 Tax=Streptomyces sp. NPDC057438 TaxID=3346133 RepID=UPI0036C6292E